jgi:hypothetical protein
MYNLNKLILSIFILRFEKNKVKFRILARLENEYKLI